MIRRLLSPLQIKQYFHRVSQALQVGSDLREDLSLLNAIRKFALPLPGIDREPELSSKVFPPKCTFEIDALRGKKVGVVATGGGGAMMCAIGVIRACEEAGLDIAGISACSGSAMALAPIAAGMDAQAAADFTLGWRSEDYLDPAWGELLKIPLALGRNFTGIIKAEAIEDLFAARFGRIRVEELPIPFYANIWDMDHNRLHYLGTRTKPEMDFARLVRAAITLPLFMRPLEIDGAQCGDGGVVNIFPVDPLVDLHPEIDFFIGINAFYPEMFDGEDHTGWHQQTFSMLRVSTQPQQSQHLEAARMQLRRIEDRCVMCHPLPYRQVRGPKLYEHFLDRSHWAEFVSLGHQEGRRQLETLRT